MASFDLIPSQVDCVIIGTGLTNSIAAAALSRIGKSVLHVDKNPYYGDQWASFTLQQLLDWIKGNDNLGAYQASGNVPEELLNKSRMFCIDLSPRLLFSNGYMVQLLVKSNVTRYHDFKNNIRILSMVDNDTNDIHFIPCQRSDVFTSPILSNLVDKRKLMKFIELCVQFDPDSSDDGYQNNEIVLNHDKPIGEFLEQKGLNSTIRDYIINSIAMIDARGSTMEACKNIKNFMVATQRFGNSPFLFPMYGCGEFPQSFCRLSAVFGGVYCLNTQVKDITLRASKFSANDAETQKIRLLDQFEVELSNNNGHKVTSKMLIVDNSSAIDLKARLFEQTNFHAHDDKLARAILITKISLFQPNDGNLISFMRIPSNKKKNQPEVVYLLELNSTVMVCPQGFSLVYLWTKATAEKAKDDLEPVVDRIYKDTKSDSVLWELYYHQPTRFLETDKIDANSIDGLHITDTPYNDIDYDHCIHEAEQIFNKLCPGEEFLPRAPDPDEIITS